MTALLACSHGTRSSVGRAAITSLVDAVGRRMGPGRVVQAYVDVQVPDIGSVVASHDGPAVVVPLLLSSGFHVHVDIAEAVASGPLVAVGSALGPDDALTTILQRRLREAGATAHDRVVLAVAGSSDGRAVADIDAAARLLARRRGEEVPVGFIGAGGPPIAEVVAAQRAARPGHRIVVASYLMAPGFFHDRLRGCGADLVTRPLLDADEDGVAAPPVELVNLVLTRFRAARGTADARESAA